MIVQRTPFQPAYWRSAPLLYVSAGGISGTLSATLGALTLSATGTVDIAGTVSKTLGALTLSSTGTVDIAGTLSKTLGALTLSSTATLDISGTASNTLGALTSNATGALDISGVLSQTLGALTLTADGTGGVTGVVDATLGALTLSATGELSGQASIAQPTGGGVSRKKRYFIEIDNQRFLVSGQAEAEAFIQQAQAVIDRAAEAESSKVEKRVKRAIAKGKPVTPIRIDRPQITASPELDLSALRASIERSYRNAAVLLELRLLMERKLYEEDDEDILLLM